jgi:parallel beta-helix repeat protein
MFKLCLASACLIILVVATNALGAGGTVSVSAGSTSAAPPSAVRSLSVVTPTMVTPIVTVVQPTPPSVVAPSSAAGATASAASNAVAARGARQVSTSGTDTGNCIASACKTIAYAVGQASAGDTVDVAAGTYAGGVTLTKELSLVGNGATIDAAGHDNGIVVTGPATTGSSVRGFTVEHANLEGILAEMTSGLSISDNTVMDNDLAFGTAKCAGSASDCGEGLHLMSVTNSRVRKNSVHDNVGGILLTDEAGPTAHNLIADNSVLNNTKDCGITLASHFISTAGPAAPSVAGVYENLVLHNTSSNNGAAGIGFFAGGPGGATWGNTAIGNTASGNGIPGIAIHSHTGGQNLNDNRIVGNTVSGNGADEEDTPTPGTTGVNVFSVVTRITGTVVVGNHISNEQFGIYVHLATVAGLGANMFTNVTVPITVQ